MGYRLATAGLAAGIVLETGRSCIAVTNTEMDEIWKAVPDGTPIEIRP
jgi:hypothetical protein